MWLLENTVKDKLESAYKQNLELSADVYDKLNAIRADANVLTKQISTAIITIDGVLTQKPNFLALLLGLDNTIYADISDALISARDNEDVDSIQLNINSPGGEAEGLFNTLDILSSIDKPITAVVDLAASAAYAIAAQADQIIAKNRAVMVGSIGVVATIVIDDDIIDITSTNAPDKRPDVTTEEGKKVVRNNLDAVEALFIESIANGRNTTIDDVKNNFGRGAILLADDAKSKNMIDDIMTFPGAKSQKTDNLGVKTMNLEDFKAQHSDIFAQAKKEGVEQERERVKAHLILAEAYNANEIAFKAIKEGVSITPTLQAEYLAAGANRENIKARADDNPDAVVTETKEENIADKLYTKLEERLNV